MKFALIIILLCTCCLAHAESDHTPNTQPPGPIRLEEAPSPHGGPLYSLSLVKLAGVKPASSMWFLQEQVYLGGNGITELHSTAFDSLNSPALRTFISHLPKNAELVYSRIQPVDATIPEVQGPRGSEKGLSDFIRFCRDHNVNLIFGVTF